MQFAALMLQLTTLTGLTCSFVVVFFFETDNLPSPTNFVFLHRHENSYLLFHSGFSLILFIFLFFRFTIILFGVKARYFYYGKCCLAVWL